jgi:hypothetical protein
MAAGARAGYVYTRHDSGYGIAMSIVTAQKGTAQRRQPTSGLERLLRVHIVDVLALGALAVTAWFVAGFLLRDDLFIFGDHPGQYWRLWYTLNIAWPLHHRIIDWIPYWYAGYPELQFYPPGYVLFGWLLNIVTAGTLSTVWIYEIITFVSYALPGFTFYYAIRHFKFGHRAAIAAGLFGLICPVIWGGASAPFIGMVGSRLAFGLNGLVLVWAIDFLEARGPKYAWLSIGALASGILAHPYHEIGIVLAVGLYILFRPLPLRRSCLRLFILIVAAFALDAFWTVPVLAHSSTNVVPIIRATLDQTWRHLTDQAMQPYVLLALATLPRLWREKDPARRAVMCALAALVPVIAAGAIADHAIVINQFKYYQLDPVRLLGEYYFSIVLLAAIGTCAVGDWVARIPHLGKAQGTAAWTGTLLPCALMLLAFLPAHDRFYPRENGEPRFLKQAIADYRLDELWDVLRASQGRVLFTSNYMRLNARDNGDLNTTIPALTPLFTNRPLMGGTFSHWSPIAAFMWSGSIDTRVLWGRVEEVDDRSLLGVPLEEFSNEQLYAFAQRYNVTTVVASVNDFQTRTLLDAAPHFQSYYNNGYFFVYRVEGYDNVWIDASDASVELVAFKDDDITLRVRAAGPNASVGVKVYAYPLWRASTDAGRELVITRDDWGLMRIPLPRGENYSVMLRYEDGIPERLGTLISIAAAALFLSSGAVRVAKRLVHRGDGPALTH